MATSKIVPFEDDDKVMTRQERAALNAFNASRTPDRLTITMLSWPGDHHPFRWVAQWRSVNKDGSITTRVWREAFDLSELLSLLEKAGVKLS